MLPNTQVDRRPVRRHEAETHAVPSRLVLRVERRIKRAGTVQDDHRPELGQDGAEPVQDKVDAVFGLLGNLSLAIGIDVRTKKTGDRPVRKDVLPPGLVQDPESGLVRSRVARRDT